MPTFSPPALQFQFGSFLIRNSGFQFRNSMVFLARLTDQTWNLYFLVWSVRQAMVLQVGGEHDVS